MNRSSHFGEVCSHVLAVVTSKAKSVVLTFQAIIIDYPPHKSVTSQSNYFLMTKYNLESSTTNVESCLQK